ncbi:MAG TPA: PAS domain S-box protein, partial [Thermosynechococcaceae cyanobacterium]
MKELLHAVVELTPLPVAITSVEGNQVLLKNQLVDSLFDIPDGETLEAIDPRFHISLIEKAQLLNRLKRGGQLTNHELQLKTARGEIRDTFVSAKVVEYEGQPAILWIWTDVTQQKQVQQLEEIAAQKQAEAALQASEARFRAIAEASPTPVIISRVADGLLLYANALVEQTFGLSGEELMGYKAPDLYHDAIDRQAMLERLFKEGHIPHLEVRVKKADGTLFWVSISLRLITFDNEAAVLSAFYDITERKQAEATLQAQARQQAAVAQLGQQALIITNLALLFDEAVRLVAQVLEVELCGLWKLLPNNSTLLLQAGTGWQNGLVGAALVGTQAHSPLGYTLLTQASVLIEDFQIDTQFSGPPLLHNHRVVSGVSIPIPGQAQAFGVLGCYTTQSRTFTQDDIHFLQTIANVLASATSRHQSESRLHLMERAIASSSNGVVLTDANQSDNPIIYVNPAFEGMTGYKADEVIGRNCRFLQGDDREQPALETLRTAIQEQRECCVTLRNYRKDGTPFWNELYVAPVFDAERYLTHFVGIQTDITERKRAEEALRQQEEQYRRIVETATEGIWTLDQNSNTSYVNRQTAAMMGYSIDEMLGKPLSAFMDDEGMTLATLYLERRRQGVREMHDFKFCRKDGTELWAILSTAPMFDEQGSYLGALGMLTDITARRQAEVALRESEQRLNGILRSLKDVVWSISATTQETLYLNPAAEEIYSRPVTEFLNNPNLWMQVVHPDDRKRVRVANQALRHKKSNELEYRIIRPDGNVRWLHERCRAIRDATGQVIRVDGIATDITERKRMEAQLVHDAYHDALTGLPNRVLFMEQLKQVIARVKRHPDRLFAVLFLDLDRFKVINDSLGHLVGDQLLVAIAQRLTSCVTPDDTVARLGGDEFTILLNSIEDPNRAEEVAEQIHQALKRPFSLSGYEVFTTASIGIASSVTGYAQPEEVLRDADAALYHAKEHGKARSVLFDAAMYNQAMALLQLETALRWAIERQELRVYYQPIVSLTTGRIVGFEALVRWLHPEQGLVSPAQFIPIAEETGLIVSIGQWVLAESCRQLRQWQTQFPTASTLTISVNLSSKQFSQ